MRNFDPFKAFEAPIARRYDDYPRGDEAETVDFLAGLAKGGPVLELAIGTGRIGLPLAQRGLDVRGVEISEAMVDRLREKPGGAEIPVTIGDFADVPVDGKFALIFVVFNTFYNLLTQDRQVQCFENVARHLDENGVFVIEAAMPTPLLNLRDMQYVDAEAIETDAVTFDIARFDIVTQTLEENHVRMSESGISFAPIVTRYVWPSELDLMARIAGLTLHHRFGGWRGEPFDRTSWRTVAVYGR